MATSNTRRRSRSREGVLTRGRGKTLVLLVATVVSFYFAFRFVQPFLPAVVWAITAAVVTQPVVRWLGRRMKSGWGKAAVAVTIVAVTILAPVVVLSYFAAIQFRDAVASGMPAQYLAQAQQAFAGHPRLAAAWENVSQNLDLNTAVEQLSAEVRGGAMTIAAGSIYFVVQAMITLFILFYLYRDQERALGTVKRLSPLTDRETNTLLQRLGDTIHATIYGTVVVAIIQGALGGVVFWLLGLPGAVLWGTAMALFSVIPYLGSFVVWAPAVVVLAASGEWGKALLLVGWGTIVIGLIDNLLYPMLVGNRLRQHTVITFLAIVGGITVFGTTGIVLGPVIVTITFFLLEIWRRRTEDGHAAEKTAS